MSTETMILAGLVVYLVLKDKGLIASDTAKPMQVMGKGTDFERPTWGANWISNQWAMVMQGQLASTGQIKAGGYL